MALLKLPDETTNVKQSFYPTSITDKLKKINEQLDPALAKIPEKETVPESSTSGSNLLGSFVDINKKIAKPFIDANKAAFNPLVDAVKNTYEKASNPAPTTTPSGGGSSPTINKDVVSKDTGGATKEAPVTDPTETVNVAENVINSLLNQSGGKNSSEVYDQFMEIMNENIEMGHVMSEGEANARARDNFNGAYNKEMDETTRTLDKNALRSGFYGQLPTEQLKANAAAEIEASKQQSINQYAGDMVTDSRDAAQADYNNSVNERNQRANMLSTAVNSYVNVDNNALNKANTMNNIENDKRDQDRADLKLETDTALAEADLTGVYNGMPTMKKQQIDADISQGWTKISNDKAAQEKANASSESEYKANIYGEAYDKALEFMTGMYDQEMLSSALKGTGSEDIRNEFYGMIERYIKDYTSSSSGYSSSYDDGLLSK
jgi:hypothetical protein